MRRKNHQILTERTLQNRDFIVLRYNHVDLGHAHEDFVNRLFQIASPFELPYEDSDSDADSDTDS